MFSGSGTSSSSSSSNSSSEEGTADSDDSSSDSSDSSDESQKSADVKSERYTLPYILDDWILESTKPVLKPVEQPAAKPQATVKAKQPQKPITKATTKQPKTADLLLDLDSKITMNRMNRMNLQSMRRQTYPLLRRMSYHWTYFNRRRMERLCKRVQRKSLSSRR
jgi:hypothetical protein